QIKGTVLDEQGESIIGASVMVKSSGGTGRGTMTDVNGQFTIDVPPNATLIISYLGFLKQEVAIEGKSNIEVTLVTDARELETVVVVGYGVMRKKDLTGAVSSVGERTLQEKPVANVGEALQGRASGVQIVNSGAPGSNVAI